jgi:NhaA family Na+:H+ antiporter
MTQAPSLPELAMPKKAEDEADDDYDRKHECHSPVHMFRTKHIFVEMLEFRGDHWHETHRWNHGLEEDLVTKEEMVQLERSHSRNHLNRTLSKELNPRPHTHQNVWTTPHLPSISLCGMIALRDALREETVILDIDDNDMNVEFIANSMLDRFVVSGCLSQDALEHARENLMSHLQKKDTAVTARYTTRKIQIDCASAANPCKASAIKEAEADLIRNVSSDSEIRSDDPLKPDAEEEAMHILVDDVEWLARDIIAIIRLNRAIDTGLEEHTTFHMHCRFLVMILGPSNPQEPRLHREMGEAAAALLQDDDLVSTMYRAKRASEITTAFKHQFGKLHLMPHTTRPTPEGVRKRGNRMLKQMEVVKRIEEQQKLKRNQTRRWTRRQTNPFEGGISVGGVFKTMQKFAMPLLCGIAFALIWANNDPVSYDKWCGYGHAGGASSAVASSQHSSSSVMSLSSSHGTEHPTVLGMSVHGHDITLHFIVNDIFMCLFFGLATKEICEAFQPGGSLYPPTRTTVNVLAATIGGVAGPIVLYFVALFFCDALNLLDDDYDFMEYAIGWGIPTATDISVAWVSALCVFGAGHPAINYLLLLAIVDDGIGLLIIAIAYPDPNNPVNPKWLLLILVAIVIAYGLRRLRCARWEPYVILAGPFAWFGLLYAALHPSLALVFVVPLMPLNIHTEALDISWLFGDEHSPKQIETPHHAHSPLHDFEEDLKTFVDFIVLFAFGTVNAGVQVDSVGILTVVIIVSLLVGKTLGILLASIVARAFNCPPPAGMNSLSVAGVGMIASAGLTVALFISGQAFKETPALAAQAKMGALLSVCVALVAIIGSRFKPSSKQGLAPSSGMVDPDAALVAAVDDQDSSSSDDESLENVIVENAVRNLQMIKQAEHAIEKKAHMTRDQTIANLERIDEDLGVTAKRPSRDFSSRDLTSKELSNNDITIL